MNARRLVVAVGLVLLIAVGAAEGTALAWGANGGQQSTHAPGMMSGTPGAYGPGQMMGSPGGMMHGYGPGRMMHGYGQAPAQAGTPAVGATQVTIENFAFQPATIRVAPGTTVTWTNRDAAPHTVTFTDGMADSGVLRQGQSFRYTFTSPGTFAYDCTVHPAMTGTVTVAS